MTARWEQTFDLENTEALCAWNNQPPPLYARINRLKIGRDEFLRTYPEARALSDDRNLCEFLSLERGPSDEGHCYIQDPSTAIACRLMEAQAGEKILDACAAPGGKTGYLAEMMQNRGLIVACDRDPKRMNTDRREYWPARRQQSCARFVEIGRAGMMPEEITSLAPFDRILVDAPCSNTGVMRRRVDVRWRLHPEDFVRMHKRQLEIFALSFRLLKTGGILVYSTCSLEA